LKHKSWKYGEILKTVSAFLLKIYTVPVTGARLYGTITLAQPVLLWPFLVLPILLLVHFGMNIVGANFTKIIFFCSFQFF